MTIEQVQALIRAQNADDEDLGLERLVVHPRQIFVTVRDGTGDDESVSVWLVGEESLGAGYKIVMRDDGSEFGLATAGFPTDKNPILIGWYGDLKTAILSM